jgi:outer membrane protein assembly factor BamB
MTVSRGGSASSPDLSADGTRVYVNDNVDSVHALAAATGEEIWTFAIGFAPGGSPSLSPEGLLMPSGSAQGVVMALRDEGPSAALVWSRDDLVNRGIPTQAAGGRAYATVNAGGFRNDLVVLDSATGVELDREPLPGTTVFSVGTTIGPDGTVYVPSFLGELFAFGPE